MREVYLRLLNSCVVILIVISVFMIFLLIIGSVVLILV
jgi:hypothetical protein